MTEPRISSPLAGANAFTTNSETAAWSQVGLLVNLGVQLTGDEALLAEVPPGAARTPVLRQPFRRADAERVLAEQGVRLAPSGATAVVTKVSEPT